MRLLHLTAIVPRSVVEPYNDTSLINHEIAARHFGKTNSFMKS
jgi:hypothetical protein